jgi:hypothetical protein
MAFGGPVQEGSENDVVEISRSYGLSSGSDSRRDSREEVERRMRPSVAPRRCPLVLAVGLVLHGVGTVGFVSLFLGMTMESGDPLWVGVGTGAPLLLLALTSVVAWGLHARRPWAGGLALARAILSLLVLGVLTLEVVVFAFFPLLSLPWLPAVAGEILLCIGGIVAFVRSRH